MHEQSVPQLDVFANFKVSHETFALAGEKESVS